MLLGSGLASPARRDAMLRLAARGTRSLSQTTVSSSAVGAALVHVSKQRVLDDSVEIAVVKMARKPVNSLNTDLILALRDTIKQLEHDKVRGMVLASDCKVSRRARWRWPGLAVSRLARVESSGARSFSLWRDVLTMLARFAFSFSCSLICCAAPAGVLGRARPQRDVQRARAPVPALLGRL